jgi:hypothetical protein
MQYLLSMFQPGDTPPPSVDMEKMVRELDDLRERMQRPASGCSPAACSR